MRCVTSAAGWAAEHRLSRSAGMTGSQETGPRRYNKFTDSLGSPAGFSTFYDLALLPTLRAYFLVSMRRQCDENQKWQERTACTPVGSHYQACRLRNPANQRELPLPPLSLSRSPGKTSRERRTRRGTLKQLRSLIAMWYVVVPFANLFHAELCAEDLKSKGWGEIKVRERYP